MRSGPPSAPTQYWCWLPWVMGTASTTWRGRGREGGRSQRGPGGGGRDGKEGAEGEPWGWGWGWAGTPARLPRAQPASCSPSPLQPATRTSQPPPPPPLAARASRAPWPGLAASCLQPPVQRRARQRQRPAQVQAAIALAVGGHVLKGHARAAHRALRGARARAHARAQEREAKRADGAEWVGGWARGIGKMGARGYGVRRGGGGEGRGAHAGRCFAVMQGRQVQAGRAGGGAEDVRACLCSKKEAAQGAAWRLALLLTTHLPASPACSAATTTAAHAHAQPHDACIPPTPPARPPLARLHVRRSPDEHRLHERAAGREAVGG